MEPILHPSLWKRIDDFIDAVIAVVAIVATFIGIWLLIVAGTSIFVFYLWNALLPDLFGWPPISFWQACGLNLLCGILFRAPQPPKKGGG
jgi:choline-glycine betaine transporter